MVRQRQPDDDESADEPPEPDRCALLDEYWAALGSDSAAELRQKLIDRDRPGDSIAVDLDVLDKLHQARCAARGNGESSQLATTWLTDSFAMEACNLLHR